MNQGVIFGPVFAMFVLTMFVWVYMYARRIAFIRGAGLTPDELTPLAFAQRSPPAVSNPSDNLKNLFEIPVIFYALALYLFFTAQVDMTYMVAAWIFVAFRFLHSAIHCTINAVLVRFYLYLVSTLALWFMTLRAAVEYLGG